MNENQIIASAYVLVISHHIALACIYHANFLYFWRAFRTFVEH